MHLLDSVLRGLGELERFRAWEEELKITEYISFGIIRDESLGK